jgi:hypothetical protein
MQRRCKYNNRGSDVFYGSAYLNSTELNQIRMRMERVLGSQGKSVRPKIYCELL